MKLLIAIAFLLSVVAAREWGWAVLLAWLALPVLWVLPYMTWHEPRWVAALVMFLGGLTILIVGLLISDFLVAWAGGMALCIAWILKPKRLGELRD